MHSGFFYKIMCTLSARLFHLSFELVVRFPHPCQCGMRGIPAQRKIPVVLHFLHHRHKAGGASPLA